MWKRDTSPQPIIDTPQPTVEPPPHISVHTPPPGPTRVENRPHENALNLGKSVMIKGEVSASEDLTLFGQMDGRVTLTDHTLTIGPDADIRAEISASVVVVMGSVSGNVSASQRVEIRATGSVEGDVASGDLVIHEGGRLQGTVAMHRTKGLK
jgi:cytoskeletal protein CcmA (bactofilin family)